MIHRTSVGNRNSGPSKIATSTCLVPEQGLERKGITMERLNIGVIGAGRVGAVVAARLRAAGHKITAVSGRSHASALRIGTLIPQVTVASPSKVAAGCDVLIIAVPDDALVQVVHDIAGIIEPGCVVVHTSGRHGVGVLEPLTLRGARPIALHPAMTFTGTDIDLDRTCVFGITAGAAEHDLAEMLVSDLGGTPMWIREDDRALYHAALVHGSNHLATLVLQSMGLLRDAGAAEPSEVLRPLLTAALDNVLAYGDAAMTGPVVRGDRSTIRAHLEAFANADVEADTVAAYAELAKSTVSRAVASGRLSVTEAGGIRRELVEADWNAMAQTVAAF